MANICENMLYLSTDVKENYEKLVGCMEQTFKPYFVEECGECSCEMEFDSKWTFPQEAFQKLTDEIGKDDSLYIRVLSYEFGCDYVGYNIFQNNEWVDKINQ